MRELVTSNAAARFGLAYDWLPTGCLWSPVLRLITVVSRVNAGSEHGLEAGACHSRPQDRELCRQATENALLLVYIDQTFPCYFDLCLCLQAVSGRQQLFMRVISGRQPFIVGTGPASSMQTTVVPTKTPRFCSSASVAAFHTALVVLRKRCCSRDVSRKSRRSVACLLTRSTIWFASSFFASSSASRLSSALVVCR